MIPIVDIFKNNRWHFVTWGVLFSLILLASSRFGWEFAIKAATLNCFGTMALTYINIFFLLPKYLSRKKLRSYIYLSLAIITVIGMMLLFCHLDKIFLYPVIKDKFFHGAEFRSIYPAFKYMTVFLITLFVSTSVYISMKGREGKIKWDNMISEKRDFELKFLRAQINPHFLFNTLNNVYSQVYMKEEGAADNILKLSDMLRYVIDDCAANTVPLQKEVDYLNNFIDFQNLKCETPLNISFETNIEDPKIQISPLLFIPIVENCFKHGKVDKSPESFVKIELNQTNNKIELKTANTIDIQAPKSKNRDGIGIENLRKRLQLIYDNNHKLTLSEKNGIYHVELTIHTKRISQL